MNVKFLYLYRDGANYKNFNEIVFANPNVIDLTTIEGVIGKHLIDGQWFVAKKWNVPDLHFREFPWDPEINHEWHEFEKIEETREPPTNEDKIDDFLLLISLPNLAR